MRSLVLLLRQTRNVFAVVWLTSLLAYKAHAQPNSGQQSQYFHDNVLGTSFQLSLMQPSRPEHKVWVEQTLAEISRLEKILSVWDDDSEVSRLNTERKLTSPSSELIEVLRLCNHWQQQTNHAFSCKMGSLKPIWEQAERSQHLPDRVSVRKQARALNRGVIRVSNSFIELDAGIKLDLDGIAKGYILEKVAEFIHALTRANVGFKLDIGGDIRTYIPEQHLQGSEHWLIGVADPNTNIDRAISTVKLTQQAIAASGSGARFYNIRHTQYSHILKSRDGWPTENAPASVVIAPNATTADAVATALVTMPPQQGLNWINKLDGIGALLILSDGRLLHSDNWPAFLNQPEVLKPKLRVDFQIPDLEVQDYRRPYLAIWLTDKNNQFIKHLVLQGDDPSWAHHNRKWWRKVARHEESILDGLARATRRPGHYSVEWNGLDDFGQRVHLKELVLHIEAVREHGGRNYHQERLNLADAGKKSLSPDGEIGQTNIVIF